MRLCPVVCRRIPVFYSSFKKFFFLNLLLVAPYSVLACEQHPHHTNAISGCELYPIALAMQSVSNLAPGTVISNIFNGTHSGNFGWLTWNGSPSVPSLVRSLTPPGNSYTYVNRNNRHDHEVSEGDWVESKPGVSNSRQVREALDELKQIDINLPVWDMIHKTCHKAEYRVCAFARVRILDYHLSCQNRITVRFLGFTSCDANQAPVVDAGPDQVITNPSPAILNGTITDDGLPAGSVISNQWAVISGPGNVQIDSPNSSTANAFFEQPGEYTLRLTATDSALSGYDEIVITVNAANQPPTAESQEVATDEDTPLAVMLNGSDPDGDSLTYSMETLPGHGSITGAPPAVVYYPIQDYNGTDSFTFKVNDGELDSEPATVSITINPVNDAPVADNVTVTNDEDVAVLIQLSGADVEGDAITCEIVGAPAFGQLGEVSSNAVLYTPNPNNYGEDLFYYVVTDGSLVSSTATVYITTLPVNDPPIANEQTVSLDEDTSATVLLSGSDVDEDPLSYEITVFPSNGTLTGTAPALAYVPASNYYGPDSLAFVVYDSSVTSAPAVVNLSILSVNDAPVANAGDDQLIDFPSVATLSGTATDDGTVTSNQWSVISGTGNVQIENGNSAIANVSFDQAGLYILRFTVSDGELSGTDELTISVNAAPVVQAGADRVVESTNATTITGSVTDDGLPPSTAQNVAWSKISGPGAVYFNPANAAETTVRVSEYGDYVLRLSSTDSRLAGSDDVQLSVRPSGPNQAPMVNAGADQTIGLTSEVVLQGTISDDSLPWGAVISNRWSVTSGPGNVQIENQNSSISSATFDQPGEYVLRLEASDSELMASDEVTITIYPSNLPPTVHAGPDQVVNGGTTVLSGTVVDDGLPEGSVISNRWSVTSGPGDVTIENRNSAIANVSFDQPGVYVMRLESSDSEFLAFDALTVTVSGNMPPQVDAGSDQAVDFYDTSSAPTSAIPAVPESQTDHWIYNLSVPGLTEITGGTVISGVSRNGMDKDDYDLYLTGSFKYAGGILARGVAHWSGCSWESMCDPRLTNSADPCGSAYHHTPPMSIASWGDNVYLCGQLNDVSLPLDGWIDFVGRWDGDTWDSMNVLWFNYADHRCLEASSNALYLGGQLRFQPVLAPRTWQALWTPVPGVPYAANIAKWTGTNWETMGSGIYSIGENPTNGSLSSLVNTIEAGPDNAIYAGGLFTMQTTNGIARNVARWNGTDWEPVGEGVSGGQVLKLAMGTNGILYACGYFTNAGGVTVRYLAQAERDQETGQWTWGHIGNNASNDVNNLVNTLEFYRGNLFAGGRLSTAGNQSTRCVARWDGQRWWPLGTDSSNGCNGEVYALASTKDGLYIGGTFTSAGGLLASGIVEWGVDITPTLEGPPPLVVTGTVSGAEVNLTALAGHRCGNPLLLIWNVDGGPAEQTNLLAQGASAPPAEVPFTFTYSPGFHIVSIVMDDGKTAPQTWTTFVTVAVPAEAALDGLVSDDGLPSGSVVSSLWSVVSGPGNAQIENGNSLSTSAFFDQPGTYLLRLTASDGELSDYDDLVVTVRSIGVSNFPPSVSAGPDRLICLDESASLNGLVSDDGLPEGSVIGNQWSVISGTGSVQIENPNSQITTATFEQPGEYTLRLTADDGQFSGYDEVTVTVRPETNQPPVVNAGADQTVMLSEADSLAYAVLNGSVTDDGLPYGLLVGGQWSVVSGPSSAVFHYRDGHYEAVFSTAGVYELRLTATDGRVEVTDDVTITVLDYVGPATLEITSPTNTQQVTAPTTIMGSISSPIVASWELQCRLLESSSPAPSGVEGYSILASGSTAVVNSDLGTLDPTMSLNGIYELRLVAIDLAGRSTTSETVTVVFDGNMKVGLFTLSFEDLSVPLAGIPIQVVRTYDSRSALAGRAGDFGAGWTLSLKDLRLQKNRAISGRWRQEIVGFTGGTGIPIYEMTPNRERVVTVTLPDNKVYRFRAAFTPSRQVGVPIVSGSVSFEALTGTYGALEVDGENTVRVIGDVPYYDPMGGPSMFSGIVDLIDATDGEYEPVQFRFKTPDGTTYIVREVEGLCKVYDLNGNEVVYADDGIFHSSGESIQFIRDSEGRIMQIIDPSGVALNYSYTTNAELVAFTDRTTNTTSFTYIQNHLVEDILDPRSIRVIRGEYDPSGRLISQTDADGHPIEFGHDIENRRETITDRLGHVTMHEYDDRGNVVKTIDPLTNITRHVYDDFDNEIATIDALGHVSTSTYDSRGNKLTETDSLSNTVTYTYNSFSQPLTIRDARGHTTRYTYDVRGNLKTEQDAMGNLTTYTYDLSGNLLTRVDALGNVTSNEYDGLGRVVRSIDPRGVPTTYTYDANGNQTSSTFPISLSPFFITTSNVYDTANRLIQVTNPDGSFTLIEYNEIEKEKARIDERGRRTEMVYNDRGELIRTLYPDGGVVSVGYDEEGRKVAETNQAGYVILFEYDALGRQVATIHPDGAIEETIYDATGRAVESVDAQGNSTTYGYDEAGRRTAVTNALGQVTQYEYDENGNMTAMTDAAGHTTEYVYDALNRRTQVIFPDETTQATTYDSLGRRIADTDQAGITTTFGYDELGRLATVTNALNDVTRYEYDERGNQTAQTDANGHVTRFEYDNRGRRTKRILPEGQIETNAYDTVGNLVVRTDFNGKTTVYEYDEMNRQTAKIPDASFNAPTVEYTYDRRGLRTTMTDASGITTFEYDERGRLTEKATPIGTLNYSYDLQGNLTTTKSSNVNGTLLSYSYDSLNRLKTVTDRNGLTMYHYDEVGNLQDFILPNGVNQVYAYDSLNRLTNLVVNRLAAPIESYRYTLGASGHRLAVQEGNGRQVAYRYDNLYRLTRETILGASTAGDIGYGFDLVGNRMAMTSTVFGIPSATYNYDQNDQLDSDTYDANGNTVLGTTSATALNCSYDFENRIISAQSAPASPEPPGEGGSSAVSILYDGDGNRVAKTVNGVATHYLVDDRNLTGYAQVMEELATGAVSCVYSYGLDLLSQTQLTETQESITTFYGYDGHGNVRFLSDTNGYITDRYDYDAYGKIIASSGTTPNKYLYCGEQYDSDLGLYFLRARYMNLATGRFWTMDSFQGLAGDPQSLHKYLYAHASPADYSDPTGHLSLTETVVVNAVIGIWATVFVNTLKGLSDPWEGFGQALAGGALGAVSGAVSFKLALMAKAIFGPRWLAGAMAGSGTAAVSQFLAELKDWAIDGNPISVGRIGTASFGGLVLGGLVANLVARYEKPIAESWEIVSPGGPVPIMRVLTYAEITSPDTKAGAVAVPAILTLRAAIQRLFIEEVDPETDPATAE